MKIVIDTNVLIAALISRGTCHELLEYCFLTHDLITSDFILDEVKDKLVSKFKFSAETSDDAVALLRSRMETVAHVALSNPVSRDADDDNILATAVTGNCDCIITGDNDLLVLKRFEEIGILSPRGFLDAESAD